MTAELLQREKRRLKQRQAIIDVAREVFFEKGYGVTRMSEIACILGGSKSTLWRHFPSKDVLFAEVVEHEIAKFCDALRDILDARASLQDTLHRFAERFVTHLVSPSSIRLQRIIVSESVRFPELNSIFYERGPGRVLDVLGQYLSGAVVSGEIQSRDPNQSARQLLAMLQFLQQLKLWSAFREEEAIAQQAYTSSCVDTFLRAHTRPQLPNP